MRWSLLVLVGCMPQPDGGIEVKGRHITLHVDPSIPICANAVAVADRYIEDVAAALGVTPPPVEYYLMDGPTGCGYGQYANSSCTLERTVYSTTWIHFHELVHAVDDTYPPALFVEGLAEALSKPSRDARGIKLSRPSARLDLDSSAFRAGVPQTEYMVAGDFLRFVIERFGGERYEHFAHSVQYVADPITTRRAFALAFGANLDDVIAQWRATEPAASTMRVPVDDVECQDPIAPVAPDTWRVDEVVPDGCTSGATANGASYTQRSGRYGFEVTEPGVFVVEAQGDSAQTGSVRSCATGERFDYVTSGATKQFLTVPLVAGRHAIEIGSNVKAWGVARLGTAGDSCKTAPTFAAPAGDAWQLDIRGTPSTWIRITHDGARQLYTAAAPEANASACWGTCGDLHCQPIAWGAWLDDPPGHALYIVVGATAASSPLVTVKAITRS